jgi:hypothetical protein
MSMPARAGRRICTPGTDIVFFFRDLLQQCLRQLISSVVVVDARSDSDVICLLAEMLNTIEILLYLTPQQHLAPPTAVRHFAVYIAA